MKNVQEHTQKFGQSPAQPAFVEVNGERQPWAPTLEALLNALALEGAHVATAVNGAFVPASVRSETSLEAGDEIEILAPMQGG